MIKIFYFVSLFITNRISYKIHRDVLHPVFICSAMWFVLPLLYELLCLTGRNYYLLSDKFYNVVLSFFASFTFLSVFIVRSKTRRKEKFISTTSTTHIKNLLHFCVFFNFILILNVAADIRIGDFWGEKHKNNNKGVSCVLGVTEKGKDILNNFFTENSMYSNKIDMQEIKEIKCGTNNGIKTEPHFNSIFNRTNKQFINLINKPMLPYEIRCIINMCRFIVAKRMHPSSSGLECEVPSIVFSYGSKYEGIFNALYKIPEVAIDIRKFSNKDALFEECICVIDFISNLCSELKQKVHDVNLISQPKVLEAIRNS